MVARADFVVILGLGPHAAHHRNSGAQYVHWVSARGKLLECMLYRLGQSSQTVHALLVSRQFRHGRQFAMHQEILHFGELAVRSQISDVVAAIMQVVAILAHGADRGFTGCGTGQRY